MTLKQKLQDAVDYHNKLQQQINELEQSRQQLIGRIQTYQELLQEDESIAEPDDAVVVEPPK